MSANRDRLLMSLVSIQTQLSMMNVTAEDIPTIEVCMEANRVIQTVLDHPEVEVPAWIVYAAQQADMEVRLKVSEALRRRLK